MGADDVGGFGDTAGRTVWSVVSVVSGGGKLIDRPSNESPKASRSRRLCDVTVSGTLTANGTVR